MSESTSENRPIPKLAMPRVYIFAFAPELGTNESFGATFDRKPEIIDWRYEIPNVIFLVSFEDAGSVSQIIEESLDEEKKSNHRYIVAEITDNRQGVLRRRCWQMLGRNPEYNPEEQIEQDSQEDLASGGVGFKKHAAIDISSRLTHLKNDYLQCSDTTGSARRWWNAFESENSNRMGLVLRLAEELAARGASITEFFLAYVHSNVDNIMGNLHYLDYTRIKKQEAAKKDAEQDDQERIEPTAAEPQEESSHSES